MLHFLTILLLGFCLGMVVILALPGLRRAILSDRIFAIYRKILPPMSNTEKEALEAGTVWWDGDLFSGKPDWDKFATYQKPQLTAEEQHFLDHETETLCAMVNDWETTEVYRDLPPKAWHYLKDAGFLGMIIPKQYGGKAFSAYAHSQVVTKLSTRCSAVAISVMVPNSLGPAELLLHYGTEAQKDYYLPRLAKGLEIPCFALTNPNAGSDAAAIPDRANVCWGEYQGQRTLGLRVTWDKRYITLGPIATLLGLAFRVYDPEHLLSPVADRGITCALIPTNHPGVNIGRRHFPLNAVFQNGPNWGSDVFIPMDWVIGGEAQIGQGWKMLMNCLAAGRAISLPSSNVGMAKLAVRATGAYSRVRAQFKTPIGKFEGVEEALTRMGGNLYLMDAARMFTASAVDQGEKPSVASAIVKYHVTERGRQVINDAMDVLGGKGICLGPNNFIGRAYQQIPIGITVEGANILTRSLIIFGQGAIRCHPFVLSEMRAAQDADTKQGAAAFDLALWGHIRFTLANAFRAFGLGITGSHFVSLPNSLAPEMHRHYQKLNRFSAAFAFISDVSMLVLGGGLKRREKLSARLGDVLSQMYLCSAVLKRYEVEGRQAADLPLVEWAIWDAMFKAQNAIEGVLANYPSKIAARVLKWIIFPLGRPYVVPSDELGHQVAKLLITPSDSRDRLTACMYLPTGESEPVGVIELALAATLKAEAVEKKVRDAMKSGAISGSSSDEWVNAVEGQGLISAAEVRLLAESARLTAEVVRVDHFPQDLGLADATALANSIKLPALGVAA